MEQDIRPSEKRALLRHELGDEAVPKRKALGNFGGDVWVRAEAEMPDGARKEIEFRPAAIATRAADGDAASVVTLITGEKIRLGLCLDDLKARLRQPQFDLQGDALVDLTPFSPRAREEAANEGRHLSAYFASDEQAANPKDSTAASPAVAPPQEKPERSSNLPDGVVAIKAQVQSGDFMKVKTILSSAIDWRKCVRFNRFSFKHEGFVVKDHYAAGEDRIYAPLGAFINRVDIAIRNGFKDIDLSQTGRGTDFVVNTDEHKNIPVVIASAEVDWEKSRALTAAREKSADPSKSWLVLGSDSGFNDNVVSIAYPFNDLARKVREASTTGKAMVSFDRKTRYDYGGVTY